MNHLIVTPTALFFAVALVTVAFFISLKEKIGLELTYHGVERRLSNRRRRTRV